MLPMHYVNMKYEMESVACPRRFFLPTDTQGVPLEHLKYAPLRIKCRRGHPEKTFRPWPATPERATDIQRGHPRLTSTYSPQNGRGQGHAPRENFSTVASYAGACNGHPTGAPIGEHLNMHPLKTKAGEAPLEKINYRISYACSRHGALSTSDKFHTVLSSSSFA